MSTFYQLIIFLLDRNFEFFRVSACNVFTMESFFVLTLAKGILYKRDTGGYILRKTKQQDLKNEKSGHGGTRWPSSVFFIGFTPCQTILVPTRPTSSYENGRHPRNTKTAKLTNSILTISDFISVYNNLVTSTARF